MTAIIKTAGGTLLPARSEAIAGSVAGGFVAAFLLVDGIIRLVPLGTVTGAIQRLGGLDTPETTHTLGILTMLCTVIANRAPTSLLSAIMVTGQVGRAIAAHLPAADALVSQGLFGAGLGMVIWGAIRLRAWLCN
jgi:hypothetical protein